LSFRRLIPGVTLFIFPTKPHSAGDIVFFSSSAGPR
jgi:hypothetical protein